MATFTLQQEGLTPPLQLWQRLVTTNRFLAFNLFVYLGLLIFTVGASITDARLITGAPVWFKPMKFALSSILYVGTLLWMLSFVRGKPKLVRVIAVVTAVAFLVELAAISLQAFRGVRSHFNIATPFDAILYAATGFVVILIWGMNLFATGLLMREPLQDRAFAWSLRLSLIITLFGGASGYLMTPATPAQAEIIAAGEQQTFLGAHSVGVEDGGPGLPFVGWSTEGGDLRVGHFVGLHALQIIPLLGLFVRQQWGQWLSMRRQTTLVWIGSGGYLGLVLLLIWQALRGQSLIAPDAVTLITTVFIGLFVLIGFGLTLKK